MNSEDATTKETSLNGQEIAAPCSSRCYPPVLDACCGSRMFWFNKQDSRALFLDKRRETHDIDIGTPGTVGRKPVVVDPDVLASFTDMPFPDETFYLVVFDPPHLTSLGEDGIIAKKYGRLFGDWKSDLQAGFAECFRVLRPRGTLVFKWCSTDVPLGDVLALTPMMPLFGHTSGRKATTHWVTFLKPAVGG